VAFRNDLLSQEIQGCIHSVYTSVKEMPAFTQFPFKCFITEKGEF